MKRVATVLIALLVLAACAVVGAIVWIGFTESGLRFTIAQAREHLPAGIAFGAVHGQLIGALRIADIQYDDATGMRVDIAAVDLHWSPFALLRGQIRVREINARQVRVAIRRTDSKRPPPAGFRFPMPIRIDAGRIADIEIQRRATGNTWHIASLSLSALARDERIKFERLALEIDKLTITATATVGSLNPFPIEAGLGARWTGLAEPFETRALLAGDLERLHVTASTPAPYAARLDAQLHRLLTTPGWDGTLALDRVSLQPFIANARVRDLSGTLHASGNADATTLNAALRGIAQTDAPRPVLLDATLVVDPHGFDLKAFDLRSGVNGLHARGAIRDQKADLRFQVAADDLGALLPGFGGTVTGHGLFTGTRDRLQGSARLKGKGVGFGAIRAARLDLKLDLRDIKRYDTGSLDIAATDLGTATFALDRASVRVSGTDAGHSLQLNARRGRDVLRATLTARLREKKFDGQLRAATLHVANTDWLLVKPAAFRYHGGILAVNDTCLVNVNATLCATFDRSREGAMTLSARTRDATLAILKAWLPVETTVSGRLDAALDARVAKDGAVSGTLDVTVGAGETRFGNGDGTSRIRHDGGTLRARADAGMLTAQLKLVPAPASRIEGDWSLPFDPLRKPAGNTPLTGTLRAELADLSLIAPFIPAVASPKGRVAADLRFSGSVAKPRMNGTGTLEDGAVGLPRLGIRLDPVHAQFTGTDDGSLRIHVDARSGGTLNLDGNLRWLGADGPSAAIDVSGSDFIAARLPGIDLTMTPRLQLALTPRLVRIRGDIAVPRGRITGRNLQNAQTVSNDVVIVGRQEQTKRTSAIAVDANVNVRLGDSVHVDVVGVTGRIRGALAIRQLPGQEATGVGELTIADGRYEGYGHRLEIERGRLVFAGSLVTDPRLDVRAVRHIEEITAGVDLTGPVSNPRVTLFSDPAMSETDVLSYMMFGRPASTASQSEGSALASAAASIGLSGGELLARKIGTRFGIEDIRVEDTGNSKTASLVLGTYLTPRIYVKYGVGLFESVNTLTLRYDLGKRWRLEAESGQSQGGDLLYSIER